MLGVRGSQFTLNDRPAFLLGFSYFAALGAPRQFVRADLRSFQDHGFNWLRVFATWAGYDNDVSVVDASGRAREPFLDCLKWLVAECDRRGMIVDVTLARGRQLPDFAGHMAAVETIVKALSSHHNWYLDLANEHDVGDARYVSVDELKELRRRAGELDADLLVTASFGGHDLTSRDVRDGLMEAGLDFLAPHRPRNEGSPVKTMEHTQEVLDLAKSIGRIVPVLYQEPIRRGYTRWQPSADEFLEDLRGAITGGAAGWCFHNGGQRKATGERPRRSFDLREARLMDQLDAEELQVVERASAIVYHKR